MRVSRNFWALPVLLAGSAWAAPPPLPTPIQAGLDAGQGAETAGLLGDLQRTNFLLGDLFGLRPALARYGVSLAIQETSEVLGNATGGTHRGVTYDGLTQAILQLDTQRAGGWYGGLLNVSALQIHGRNLSADNLASLQTASGIEADRATRLWEAWFDQKFLDEDRADIKLGQQSVDQEFIVNANGAFFVNTAFGWPLVPSVDLPGGGPAYPLANLGARLRWRPVNALTLLAGVFDGNPATASAADPQRANATGALFPLRGGTFGVVEVQYAYPAVGALVMPGEGAPLGHTYRLGVLFDSASPAGPAVTRHGGEYALYAVADQMIWRDGRNPNRAVSLFGRVVGTPEANRSVADLSLDGGIVYHDPFHRAADTVGLGFGYAHPGRLAGTGGRGGETYVEATYQIQVHPWWQVQPDLQYVVNPGGGLPDPNDPARRIGNELVLGMRTNVLF